MSEQQQPEEIKQDHLQPQDPEAEPPVVFGGLLPGDALEALDEQQQPPLKQEEKNKEEEDKMEVELTASASVPPVRLHYLLHATSASSATTTQLTRPLSTDRFHLHHHPSTLPTNNHSPPLNLFRRSPFSNISRKILLSSSPRCSSPRRFGTPRILFPTYSIRITNCFCWSTKEEREFERCSTSD